MNGSVPIKTHQFSIETVGNITTKRFIGDFTCQILNIKNRALVDKHRAFLNGEYAQEVDAATLWMHLMISHLRYALIGELPKWWVESDLGYELYDTNVIKAVYDAVMDFEAKWYTELHGVEDGPENDAETHESDADESGSDTSS